MSNPPITPEVELLSKEVIARLKEPNADKIYRAIYASQHGEKSLIDDIVECAEFDHPNYIALRKLGEGGSGKVFLAKRIIGGKVTNVELAVKVFKLDHLHPTIKGERERRELKEIIINQFQELAHVNRPNIIRMYMPEEYGNTFIVPMEYMNGGSLESHLDEFDFSKPDHQFFSVLDRVVRKVISGMADLHWKKYVLRDFKLNNVMVSADLNEVKIGDLEMITRIGEINGTDRVTTGSNKYASPELMRGERATEDSDGYALGAALYYLLSGEKPSDSGFIATINKIQNKRSYNRRLDKMMKFLETRPDTDPVYGEAIGDSEGFRNNYDFLVSCVRSLLSFDPGKRSAIRHLEREYSSL